MEEIVTLVSTIGFPIVCCIFMARFITSTMDKFTSAMNENTKMLNRICDRLDLWKEEIEKNE